VYQFRYDPKENKWGKVAPMTTRRLGVAVAVLGGFLYAIGGSDGQCPLNTGIYNFYKESEWYGGGGRLSILSYVQKLENYVYCHPYYTEISKELPKFQYFIPC
jgi:hypothetical protein